MKVFYLWEVACQFTITFPVGNGPNLEEIAVRVIYIPYLQDILQCRIQDFPLGGAEPLGVPTSNVGTFQQKHMQKWTNWIPLRGGVLDLPMYNWVHFLDQFLSTGWFVITQLIEGGQGGVANRHVQEIYFSGMWIFGVQRNTAILPCYFSGSSRISDGGGCWPIAGRCRLVMHVFLAKMHAKTKELGPLRGEHPLMAPLDLTMYFFQRIRGCH